MAGWIDHDGVYREYEIASVILVATKGEKDEALRNDAVNPRRVQVRRYVRESMDEMSV